MPFVSKAQWRQCFAAARRGQRKTSECKEFAAMSKSYKSLPEKIRKQRRTRRRIHQKAPQPGTLMEIDDFEHPEISGGFYGVNEQGQWAEYFEAGPGNFEELDLVEDPDNQEYLDSRLNAIVNQNWEMANYPQTPYIQRNMDEGSETPYIQRMDMDQMAPKMIRNRRKQRKIIKRRGSKRHYKRQH